MLNYHTDNANATRERRQNRVEATYKVLISKDSAKWSALSEFDVIMGKV